MPTTIDLPGEGAAGQRYVYKASLIGSAHQLELKDRGLSWQIGAGRSGIWAYRDIAAIRLSYRPVSMQSHRFRADISHVDGARLKVLSTTWQTVSLMKPQNQDYRAFLLQLHERMRGAGSKAALAGGIGPITYAAAVGLVALVCISIAGLFIRAIVTGEFWGALFLVGFVALFGWQIGGFIWRNRPRTYSFEDLPKSLLP